MVEWFKALVLKTSEVQASVGSNPTLSAISFFYIYLIKSQIQKPRYIFLREPARLNCISANLPAGALAIQLGEKDVSVLLKF